MERWGREDEPLLVKHCSVELCGNILQVLDIEFCNSLGLHSAYKDEDSQVEKMLAKALKDRRQREPGNECVQDFLQGNKEVLAFAVRLLVIRED